MAVSDCDSELLLHHKIVNQYHYSLVTAVTRVLLASYRDHDQEPDALTLTDSWPASTLKSQTSILFVRPFLEVIEELQIRSSRPNCRPLLT